MLGAVASLPVVCRPYLSADADFAITGIIRKKAETSYHSPQHDFPVMEVEHV